MSRTALNTVAATPGGRKLSRRGAETEQRFLDAANEVFWSHGFAGCTIAQIISAADLSIGSFYHLFADKTELLERATERLHADFGLRFSALKLDRSTNATLFTLFFRLALTGRQLVARNRGIYRAVSERAQNNIEGFGPLRLIGPAVVGAVSAAMQDYHDQLAVRPEHDTVAHAVQLITMCVLQAELGMGPLFPKDSAHFAEVIARAACGVVGYSGPTHLDRRAAR